MTDEEILDAAVAIIARRARVLQLSHISVDVYASGEFSVRKFGSTGRLTEGYMTTPHRPTLGKAWTKEETR